MEEVLPGVFHWTRVHEQIRIPVHSYFVADRGVLLDPMEPEEGLDAVAECGAPELIVLTVRHHLRHSGRFVERFGSRVVANRAGLPDLQDREVEVHGFDPGDELAPGVRSLTMGEICADDTALWIAAGVNALHFGDGLVRWDGEVGFVPDDLIGDDAEGVKVRTLERLRELLREDFDALLFAHGDPLPRGGRDALEALVRDRS